MEQDSKLRKGVGFVTENGTTYQFVNLCKEKVFLLAGLYNELRIDTKNCAVSFELEFIRATKDNRKIALYIIALCLGGVDVAKLDEELDLADTAALIMIILLCYTKEIQDIKEEAGI